MPVELRLATTTSSPTKAATQESPAPAQTNVLTRLQALFPTSAPALNLDATPPQRLRPPSRSQTHPKFLKVRIVTWNMHDSLPKGDLEELLGAVPPHTPQPLLEEPQWPQLSSDGSHPYHLVVIAGQECPSLSGIPMGLGAGFKLKEAKEHEKENMKDKEKAEKRKSRVKEKDEEDPFHDLHNHSGWTSVLEDWLCDGGGCAAYQKTVAVNPVVVPLSPGLHSSATDRVPTKEPVAGKGPYQQLIKHRMMGLYLAVYIHRDIRHLVRGTSKSAVTAGLIGGRMGNKGGLGVSLNIDGTTILLMNAHLAAHEHKVPNRLANLAKIKAELSVEDYLEANDPRMVAEDITDKFDYTFLCGDLNFRLDISRLHADFLISRQEYEQALAFDQLRNLMRNGLAFVGFREGPIDFAPTFKYDVLRTLKRAKTKSYRPHWKNRADRIVNPLHEEEGLDRDEDEEGEEEEEEGEEGASLASSNWTSARSKVIAFDDEDDLSDQPPSQNAFPQLAHRVSISAAAHKAKTKWKALVSPPSGPSTPSLAKWLRPKSFTVDGGTTAYFQQHVSHISMDRSSTPEPIRKSISPEPGGHGLLHLPRTMSTKSVQQSGDEETDDDDKGVYDSSAKKRVPSWCDRILWKSTVQPEPEPEDMSDLYRPRNRMGQFFASAFRPLSYRARRTSLTSLNSNEGPLPPIKISASPLMSPAEEEPPAVSQSFNRTSHETSEGSTRFSRFIKKSKSNEILTQSSNGSQAFPSSPQSPPLRLRRSLSADLSSYFPVHSERTSEASTEREAHHTEAPPPVPPKDTAALPVLRRRFFPFINRDASRTSIEPIEGPFPRKGDVLCLDYNTLDDRGMRRLEGRSDHRPVIGSYAVYL